MSLYAINNYYNELDKIIQFGGSKKETAIRNAFYNLLNDYARSKDLMLIAEISTKNKQGKIITPDGTIKDSIRNDWGYWESKDESDDINEEIRNKFSKGYPSDNILFEDSNTAVLWQHNEEVKRVDMKDAEALHAILTKFLQYERPEVHDFREAIEKFKEDIRSDVAMEALRKDLQEVQYHQINRFPSLVIRNKNNKGVLISGYRPYSILLDPIREMIEVKENKKINPKRYKDHWPFITERELEEIA